MLEVDESRRAVQTRVSSPFRDAVRRFMENWAAVISLVVIVLLVLAAIFAPLLHAVILSNSVWVRSGSVWHEPGPAPVQKGRTEYSRILFGLRVPFIVSIVGTFLTVVIGLVLGLVAAYFGGVVDSLLSRFTDFMFAFPVILLVIILVTVFGATFDADFPNGVG